jgi:hypothetical protein
VLPLAIGIADDLMLRLRRCLRTRGTTFRSSCDRCWLRSLAARGGRRSAGRRRVRRASGKRDRSSSRSGGADSGVSAGAFRQGPWREVLKDSSAARVYRSALEPRASSTPLSASSGPHTSVIVYGTPAKEPGWGWTIRPYRDCPERDIRGNWSFTAAEAKQDAWRELVQLIRASGRPALPPTVGGPH